MGHIKLKAALLLKRNFILKKMRGNNCRSLFLFDRPYFFVKDCWFLPCGKSESEDDKNSEDLSELFLGGVKVVVHDLLPSVVVEEAAVHADEHDSEYVEEVEEVGLAVLVHFDVPEHCTVEHHLHRPHAHVAHH